MKSENTKDSIQFSLYENNEFRDLLSDLSSSRSASVSFSFDYANEVGFDMYGTKQIKKRRDRRIKLIPEPVRNLSKNFVSNLFASYADVKEKESIQRLVSKDNFNSNFNTNYTNFFQSSSKCELENKSSRDCSSNNKWVIIFYLLK